MRLLIILCALFFAVLPGHAQDDGDYRIENIPAHLRENADAVIRLNETTVKINGPGKVQYHVRCVLSILNNKADELGVVVLPHNGITTIGSFKGRVIDARGKTFKKYNKAAGLDFTGDNPQNVTDDRDKVWWLNKLKPPYTIDFEFDLDYSSAFFIPSWNPIPRAQVAMEKGTFSLKYEPDVKANYITSNLNEPVVTPNSAYWQVNNFKAIREEDYCESIDRQFPSVMVTADDYELFGIKGSAKSWGDISHFVYQLNKERNNLAAIDDPRLKELCAQSLPISEKTKQLYRYLQNNTRYVLISKGLGGWQPAAAPFTLSKKYGDCKALAVLMQAMLRQAGITSYCLLINGGRELPPVDLRLPCSHFNHEIIMVPTERDTFWLDCTDVYSPFNYLGSFTGNRSCLIISDQGGHIIHTPVYNETANRLSTRLEIGVGEDDLNMIKGIVTAEGELQENIRIAFNKKDPRGIETSISRQLRLKNTTVKSESINELSMDHPIVSYGVELNGRNWIKKTDSRLFIKTDELPPYKPVPERQSMRTLPVRVNDGITRCDTLLYHVPGGYLPENFTNNDTQSIISDFGEISRLINFNSSTNELLFIRRFVLKMASYNSDKFDDFRNFMIKAYSACMPELVMKKKE